MKKLNNYKLAHGSTSLQVLAARAYVNSPQCYKIIDNFFGDFIKSFNLFSFHELSLDALCQDPYGETRYHARIVLTMNNELKKKITLALKVPVLHIGVFYQTVIERFFNILEIMDFLENFIPENEIYAKYDSHIEWALNINFVYHADRSIDTKLTCAQFKHYMNFDAERLNKFAGLCHYGFKKLVRSWVESISNFTTLCSHTPIRNNGIRSRDDSRQDPIYFFRVLLATNLDLVDKFKLPIHMIRHDEYTYDKLYINSVEYFCIKNDLNVITMLFEKVSINKKHEFLEKCLSSFKDHQNTDVLDLILNRTFTLCDRNKFKICLYNICEVLIEFARFDQVAHIYEINEYNINKAELETFVRDHFIFTLDMFAKNLNIKSIIAIKSFLLPNLEYKEKVFAIAYMLSSNLHHNDIIELLKELIDDNVIDKFNKILPNNFNTRDLVFEFSHSELEKRLFNVCKSLKILFGYEYSKDFYHNDCKPLLLISNLMNLTKEQLVLSWPSLSMEAKKNHESTLSKMLFKYCIQYCEHLVSQELNKLIGLLDTVTRELVDIKIIHQIVMSLCTQHSFFFYETKYVYPALFHWIFKYGDNNLISQLSFGMIGRTLEQASLVNHDLFTLILNNLQKHIHYRELSNLSANLYIPSKSSFWSNLQLMRHDLLNYQSKRCDKLPFILKNHLIDMFTDFTRCVYSLEVLLHILSPCNDRDTISKALWKEKQCYFIEKLLDTMESNKSCTNRVYLNFLQMLLSNRANNPILDSGGKKYIAAKGFFKHRNPIDNQICVSTMEFALVREFLQVRNSINNDAIPQSTMKI